MSHEINSNITPNKASNESTLKYNTCPELNKKPCSALLYCKSISEINNQNENGWTPIYRSIISNNLEALYDLLKMGTNPDIPNNLGETPLYLSVDTNNYDALIILLQYNANCNLAKNNGNTPLHIATKKNLESFISALLRNNADPNIVNKLYSQTAMHLAIINKVEENILIEFNVSKGDIYNFKDKYDKTPFDYAKDSGDQNYINLLKKIFGENSNNGGESKKYLAHTSNQGQYNKNSTPIKVNYADKNNSNYDNREVLLSFENNNLNKNISSVIIKSIDSKNLIFNDDNDKDKEEQNKENININSIEEKSKLISEEKIKEKDEQIKNSQEHKNNFNSTDTIKRLSLSNNSNLSSQIEKNNNFTISYNINKTNKSNIANLKNMNTKNSLNNKNIKKDISEMNPLDMINQIITTSNNSNIFSELRMNTNNNKNSQTDENLNSRSARENMSSLNNLMINDSLEYSKTNTHVVSEISSKRQNNEKSKISNECMDFDNLNGLNITINEYDDMNKITNNNKSGNKNKQQLSYHKQNANGNKENINSNSNNKSNNGINIYNDNSTLNNSKKISEKRITTIQNELLTQNSSSQGENIVTKIKYFKSGPNQKEDYKERISKDFLTDENQNNMDNINNYNNKFLKNNNSINNNYYINKSLLEQQSTINTYSNNNNKGNNRFPSLKLSELENNSNSILSKNINKSEELNICSPQNIQNDILARLREWLISCDLLSYYNLLIKNDMYDIDSYINNLKRNKINISYKDIEDIGMKKPGHIFRFLLRLQIDSGILDEHICNLIINKFNSNLLSTMGLTASTNIIKCCGITLFKQNGDGNGNLESQNICCNLSEIDGNNAYNDIFGFLKYKGLLEYKENFIHNGFDQIDYLFIQLFSNFKFNKEILNDYMHIYSEKDKTKVIQKLYEEKRKIAIEFGIPCEINEEEKILNTKNDNNIISKEEKECCNIF